MTDHFNLLLVFTAGITSVFSPCILPILPILVAGTEKENKSRPVLMVLGLTVTFIAMGIVTSLFGSVIGPSMVYIEKIAGGLIILFGAMMLFDINLFKKLTFLQNIGSQATGSMGGFLLGLTLGIIWIPCVGPILGSVLALVASKGSVGYGIMLLFIYSAGFSIPILTTAYAAHFTRNHIGFIKRHPLLIRMISAFLLIALGLYIIFKGMLSFGGL